MFLHLCWRYFTPATEIKTELSLYSIGSRSWFDPLRDDPRFNRLLPRLKMV